MKYLFSIALIVLTQQTFSQTVTGNWYGHADVILGGTHNNYLTELVLKQKGNEVEGVMGYYFRNSYQSFIVRGKYNPKTRYLEIKNIPIVYFRSNSKMTVDCVMDFEATLTVSKIKSNLRGYFMRDPRYRYTCPDLTVLFTLDPKEVNQDSAIKTATASHVIWKPAAEDVVVTVDAIPVIKENTTPEEIQPFEQRKTFIINEIEVESDSVRVTLYDNGDIDGDMVSVFYNKLPVLNKQVLSAQGTNLYLQLDPSKNINEISLFAENLGNIPPNTALMIVNDGAKRYELFMTSDLKMNGTVRIKKKRPVVVIRQ
ncbi:MAG: hypothetical protein SFU87_00200 [Chitinophagaceae bacterium]|nr:hypothetical protein [Chitinophagaceae bacterium]